MLVPDFELVPTPYYPHASGYPFTSGDYLRDIRRYYNFTQCHDIDTFPIYIYPLDDTNLEEKYFYYPKALRDSPLFNRTTDPHEACALVPNVETSCPYNQCLQPYDETARMLKSLEHWGWGEYILDLMSQEVVVVALW